MHYFEYLSIEDIARLYPFSKGQVRGWIHKRQENGLEDAVRRIGKRMYIRRDLLQEWIETDKKSEKPREPAQMEG